MKITPRASQKTLATTFPADCCVFGRFGALSPGLINFLTLHVIPEYSGGSMFHTLTQINAKLFRFAVKVGTILLPSGHTNAFLVDYEQLRHPSCTELSHAQMYMQNIDHTLS